MNLTANHQVGSYIHINMCMYIYTYTIYTCMYILCARAAGPDVASNETSASNTNSAAN